MVDFEIRPTGKPLQVLRVSNKTQVHDLATSIIRNEEEGKSVVLSCIGVAPNSQAVKAVAIANGRVAPQGYLFLLMPSFGSVKVSKDGGSDVERTTLRHHVVRYTVGT